MNNPSESANHPSAGGQVVLSGQPFDETVAFLTEHAGFRLERISPADDPKAALLSGFGLSLLIDRDVEPSPLTLRIERGGDIDMTAPNGVHITSVSPIRGDVDLPNLVPELVISSAANQSPWITGRAGMKYRDLIPSRLGGRYIASHIEVCDGGPVPDLVHHHAVRFQMIFCHQGWVDVVYEDQGEPFRLQPGDCVLQPPHIRHEVVASSAGAQVVEIGCPADHDTFFDYQVSLPNPEIDTDRRYGGQKFVRHIATDAPWQPSAHPGFEVQHTEIDNATDGLASVRVLRSSGETMTAPTSHDGEFWFLFVLEGSTAFEVDGSSTTTPLTIGDSVAIPAGLTWELRDASSDLRLLEVVVP